MKRITARDYLDRGVWHDTFETDCWKVTAFKHADGWSVTILTKHTDKPNHVYGGGRWATEREAMQFALTEYRWMEQDRPGAYQEWLNFRAGLQ